MMISAQPNTHGRLQGRLQEHALRLIWLHINVLLPPVLFSCAGNVISDGLVVAVNSERDSFNILIAAITAVETMEVNI